MNSLKPTAVDIGKRHLNRLTHHIHTLPIVILMPHSRCNCRCVMCDIWKANQNNQELSAADLARHMPSLRRLGVRQVVLSGGEALMHTNLWLLCKLLKELPASVTLLSTGLLLQQHAENVARWTDEVIVSLDGCGQVHDRIRRVPHAFERLEQGVAALKKIDAGLRVTARSTIQRQNYHDLANIIRAAHAMGVDQVSFLAADVSTQAFNREEPWSAAHSAEVALTVDDVQRFGALVEKVIQEFAADFSSGFIAEDPAKLRGLVRYFSALQHHADFPPHTCNAPWVSAVVEADGTVRPCFFHPPLGNIQQDSLEAVLNSEHAVNFRRRLDVHSNPTCQRCVCTLNLPSRASFYIHAAVNTGAPACEEQLLEH